MKKFAVFFALGSAVFAQDQKQTCETMKSEGSALRKKCESIGQGNEGYNQCQSELSKKIANYKKLCQNVSLGSDGGGVDDQIKQWESVLGTCGSDQSRCANATFRLGSLWRQKEEADWVLCEEDYSKKFQKWQDLGKRGAEPTKCKKSVDKSLGYFEDIIQKYPNFGGFTGALLQASYIYMTSGKEETAAQYWNTLVSKYPTDKYAPQAWLRLGEYHFNNRRNREAIDAYQKVVGKEDLRGKEGALALYHLGEALNNVGDFEAAADKFYNYVTGADEGRYPKDLRQEALEYMASCFADMDKGIDNAVKFLKRKPVAFKDTLYYYIGDKNFKRDRLDEARYSFEQMLEISPNFVWAPRAHVQLLNILDEKQKMDEAQVQRKKVVTLYGPGTAWYEANKNDKDALEDGRTVIRQAYFKIPAYHHRKAMALDSVGDIDAAKKEWANAVDAYQGFLKQYPEPAWDAFAIEGYLAYSFGRMGDHKNEAMRYKGIAEADTSKYGRRPEGVRTIHPDTAAYNAVVAADDYRKGFLDQARAELKSTVKDSAELLKATYKKAYAQPGTQFYMDYVAWYRGKWGKDPKNADAPILAYNAALVHYQADQFEKAIEYLKEVKSAYPQHKDIKDIRSLLAISLGQADRLDECQKEYEDLLPYYASSADTTKLINRAIALTMFKKAEKFASNKEYLPAAKAYLAMQSRYPADSLAPGAMLNASEQYRLGKELDTAAKVAMQLPKVYGNSPLAIKSILWTADIYKELGKREKVAETYLFLARNYSRDSLAFPAIAWAAKQYDSIPDKRKAAETYALALEGFPNHPRTPEMLYNACLTYEEGKLVDEAIQCNRTLATRFKNSSYAVDAAFSIPRAYEKGKRWKEAAEGYDRFAAEFPGQGARLVEVYYGAAKAYEQLKDTAKRDERFASTVQYYEKFGLAAGVDPTGASEAAFTIASNWKQQMLGFALKGDDKAKSATRKQIMEKQAKALEFYMKVVKFASEKWAFRALNEVGSTFLVLADKEHEQEFKGDAEKVFVATMGAATIELEFHKKANEFFEKNIQTAREQGFYNPDVRRAEEQLIGLIFRAGQTYETKADAWKKAPLPDISKVPDDAIRQELINNFGYAPEDVKENPKATFIEQYKADLDAKADEDRQKAVPTYEYCIKQSMTYQIKNESTQKCFDRLKVLDQTSQALAATWEKYDPSKLFYDKEYNSNKARIDQMMSSDVMTQKERVEAVQKMVEDAKSDNAKMKSELDELKLKLKQKEDAEAQAAAAAAAAQAPVPAPAATPAP